MTLKILVVDDEPDVPLLIRQRFRKQIQDKQIEFRFAANGREALEVMDGEPGLDIVLSDINMPEMDGLTLLGKVTERGPMPKTVMVSAYGDMENIRAAMNLGAFDFVTKPIDFVDLQTTIDKTRNELTLIKDALATRDELVGVRRELDLAARIQRSLVPRGLPAGANGRFDVYGDVKPAREVGGDFYDYFMIDATRLGFVIGDVAGKGVGAALYMAVSRTLLHATALDDLGAAKCLERLNTLLCRDAEAGLYVTICYGVLDTATGVVEYAAGGHPPPFVVRKGSAEALPLTDGTIVGILENGEFGQRSHTLAPGEFLVFYTDGVNEAANEQDEEYTIERMAGFLGTTGAESAEQMATAVITEALRHTGAAKQGDDITVLAVLYKG
jgi:sigma-B regulation protein RsbU (phosphoserine phosphatase)